MVNSVLNAVTKQLGTTFGNGYRYYLEDVEQGLVKPCFTVDMLIPLQRSRGPVLYDRTMPLVIHFFSDSKDDIKKKLYSMGEQVIECLEYLPFKNTTLRGEDISWQIVDEVLQVFVTYRFQTRVIKDSEENTIDTFDTNVSHT